MDMGTCLILIFNRVLNFLMVLRWSTIKIVLHWNLSFLKLKRSGQVKGTSIGG
jgi:hypothetical protein